jgi:hypothetical protein
MASCSTFAEEEIEDMNTKFRATLAVLAILALLGVTPTSRAQGVMVTLTILRVRQIDNVDDTRPGEFYAKVRVGAKSFPKTDHREDDGNVLPNWTFREGVAAGSTVPISIAIWDHDYPDADDHCDVSPVDGKRTLELSYDLATGRIGGDVNGNEDAVIHARGAGDSDRVEIWFRLTQSQAPPPPVRRGDIPAGPSCGSCSVSRVEGEYERTTFVDLPCPWIDSAEPNEANPGQRIIIHGGAFGDDVDRIGPCYRGEKRVMLIRLNAGGGAMPTPIRLRVLDWTSRRISALLPPNISPGRYRLGIFYPLIPGSRLSSGSVSNMVTVDIR